MLSPPVPLLQLTDEDDDSSSDSSRSTPRSSSLFSFPGPPCRDDLCHRPQSLASFDSGYFSIMGKGSPTSKSFIRKPSATDLRAPFISFNTTDATHGSSKREGVIKSLLRKRKKSSPSPPDLDPFAIGLSDESVGQIHSCPPSLPAPQSKPRDPSIEVFEEQDRLVVRRGMKHHPYSRHDAPYMLAYDRTLLDK